MLFINLFAASNCPHACAPVVQIGHRLSLSAILFQLKSFNNFVLESLVWIGWGGVSKGVGGFLFLTKLSALLYLTCLQICKTNTKTLYFFKHTLLIFQSYFAVRLQFFIKITFLLLFKVLGLRFQI